MLPNVVIFCIFGLLMRATTGSWGWFKFLYVYVGLWVLLLAIAMIAQDRSSLQLLRVLDMAAFTAVIFGGGTLVIGTTIFRLLSLAFGRRSPVTRGDSGEDEIAAAE